jgi:hypothetical protein
VRSVLFESEATYHILQSHIRLAHPTVRTSAREKNAYHVCIVESVAEILSLVMASITSLNVFLIISSALSYEP